MAVDIRLLQEHEIVLANNFFNAVYKINRPLENFRWEFLNGPSGKAIYIIAVDTAVTDQTKIVGIQCAIPIEFISSKGTIILTAKSEDTLVDPSYRGQKIFERMYDRLFDECRKAGIQYIWGFTPAQKAFERIGFEIPFKTEQALLVFNPFKAYRYLQQLNAQNTLADRFKIFGLSMMAWIKGFKRHLVPAAKSTVREVPLANKSPLFQKLYGHHDYYLLNETDPYLDWRLRQNPFSNHYTGIQFTDGDAITGDAILNARENVSYVEQILSATPEVITPMLVTLTRKARKHGTPLVRALCFSTNTELKEQGRALTKAGFTYLRRGNYFVWKSLDESNTIKPQQVLINRLFTQGNL